MIRLIAVLFFFSLENLDCVLETFYGFDEILKVLLHHTLVTFLKPALEELQIGQSPEAQDVALKEWSKANGGEVVGR